MSNRVKGEKPKPCPFCGGTDLNLKYAIIDGEKVHYVLCTRMFGFYDGVSAALKEAEEGFAKELDEIETEIKGMISEKPKGFYGTSMRALSKHNHRNEVIQEVLDIIKKHREGEEE